VIGSKGFVEEWYGKNRKQFSPNREKGAQPIPQILPKGITEVSEGAETAKMDDSVGNIEKNRKNSTEANSLFSLKGLLQLKLK